MPRSSADPCVRDATADDFLDVVRVLDAGVLETDAETVRNRIESGDALVADVDGRVVGALVLDGAHVDAVAVRRQRQNRGIGSALVEAAATRVDGPLTADFDGGVRPFYASLGFDIEERDERLWGRLD